MGRWLNPEEMRDRIERALLLPPPPACPWHVGDAVLLGDRIKGRITRIGLQVAEITPEAPPGAEPLFIFWGLSTAEGKLRPASPAGDATQN